MPFIDHFGLIAPFYEQVIPLKNLEKLKEILGLPVTGLLLDTGGGTGRVSKALQGLSGTIIVADASIGMLKQVGQGKGLLSVCTHVERLPFPDETFERVIMVDALHHVINHQQTAGELWRLVRRGGRIVIEEPNIRKLSVKVVALLEKLALMRSHFIAPKKIAGLFQASEAKCQIYYDGFNAWVIIDKDT